MEKQKEKTLSIALVVVTIALAAIIVTCGFVAKSQTKESENWVLHSYGNNVALYNGEELVEVFGSISIDILPNSDRKLLDNGIVFQTKEEALSAIEDYDG